MSVLAIIPARGGSKGIPQKNLRMVGGKPLIAYSIEQARKTAGVDRVVVSTDDVKIAEVSARYGAEVIARPAEISGDSASSEAALLHVLTELRDQEDYHPSIIVFLQCTSPLTLAVDIEGTLQALVDQNADTAVSVTPFHYFLWKAGKDGYGEEVNHDKRTRPLRQEREPQYLETGAVYAMRTEGFLKTKHRFFGKTALYVMPPERCLEIDEPADLLNAEARLMAMNHGQQRVPLPKPVSAVIFDFDGVFTDNRVFIDEHGTETVACNRSDGLGISRLKEARIPILVLSSELNPVVLARCKKLGIEAIHKSSDKAADLQHWSVERHIDLGHAIYLGNDVNDLACFQLVGCAVAVSDAHAQVKVAADLTLLSSGGRGAVRELCDLILGTPEKTNK